MYRAHTRLRRLAPRATRATLSITCVRRSKVLGLCSSVLPLAAIRGWQRLVLKGRQRDEQHSRCRSCESTTERLADSVPELDFELHCATGTPSDVCLISAIAQPGRQSLTHPLIVLVVHADVHAEELEVKL